MGLKSIFQEGMKEKRRRKSLRSEKIEWKSKEKDHSDQLTILGKKAWTAKTDISVFGDLKTALGDAQKNLDALLDQEKELQKQKQGNETARKQENDRFQASQKEMEDKKRDVDNGLSEQKKAWQDLNEEAEKASRRLAAIAAEKARLGTNTAAAAEKNAATDPAATLAREEGELKTRIKEIEESGQPIHSRITPLQEESGQLQKQIENSRAEQKKTLAERDQKIVSLAKEISATRTKIAETEKIQNLNFNLLGEKLAAAQDQDPNLTGEISAARTIRTEMEGIQALISGLERQKDDQQVSAYKKMMAIIMGGILLLAAVIALLAMLLSPRKHDAPFSQPPGQSARRTTEAWRPLC